jgi:pilus assembly protein Flp/PilA
MTAIYAYVEAALRGLRTKDEGQALVEYALILGLVSIVAIGALTLLGTNINDILQQIAEAV